MSEVLTVRQICERALRVIGAYPVTESAADGEHLREAMHWLDLVMGEIGGTERLFFLVPSTVSLSLVNGTSDYALMTALGVDLPPDGVQFPIEAWLQDSAGNRSPLELVRRTDFETVSKPSASGKPCFAYIDRLPSPTLRVYPTPAVGDPSGWMIKLLVQQYAPNVGPSGVTGKNAAVSSATKFRQSWQRFLIYQLSYDLGNGPIFKLADQRLRGYKADAELARTRLLAFENREHESTPPICEPWGL